MRALRGPLKMCHVDWLASYMQVADYVRFRAVPQLNALHKKNRAQAASTTRTIASAHAPRS